MATHSSVLAWRIPGTGEPGRLMSVGLHRVGHDCSDLAAAVCVCMCVSHSSRVWLFVVPWTVACQAPLSMGFSRKEYWSGLSFPSPGVSFWPRDPTQVSCIAGSFFNTKPPGKPCGSLYICQWYCLDSSHPLLHLCPQVLLYEYRAVYIFQVAIQVNKIYRET